MPVIVDAAAEDLTIPNIHLKRGADVGLLQRRQGASRTAVRRTRLGRKSLLEAAWVNSAPHHTFGRPMKIGREEIMGMLAAVDAWKRRDIKAEYATKRGYLQTIADRVKKVNGVIAQKSSIRKSCQTTRLACESRGIPRNSA